MSSSFEGAYIQDSMIVIKEWYEASSNRISSTDGYQYHKFNTVREAIMSWQCMCWEEQIVKALGVEDKHRAWISAGKPMP